MVSETKVNNRLQLAKLSLNTIVSVFLGGATFVICFYALNIGFGGSFMQHVILCVIGVSFLMSKYKRRKIVELFKKITSF